MSQAQSQAQSPAQGHGLVQPGDAGVNPLRLFSEMLKYFRNRAGLTSDQLGVQVHLSGSAIRKIETGRQPPTEQLVDALEAIPELACGGALRALFVEMAEYLTNGVFPGWFTGWPKKEAAAVGTRGGAGFSPHPSAQPCAPHRGCHRESVGG